MMRAVVFTAPPDAPTLLGPHRPHGRRCRTEWLDNSVSATSFTIERATDAAFPVGVTQLLTVPVTQCERPGRVRVDLHRRVRGTNHRGTIYRVQATNTVGSTVPNYPTITTRVRVDQHAAGRRIAAPAVNHPRTWRRTIISATQIRLTWTDTSNNENNFRVGGSDKRWSDSSMIATVGAAAGQSDGHRRHGDLQQHGSGCRHHLRVLRDRVAIPPRPPTASSAPNDTVTLTLSVPAAPTLLEGFALPDSRQQQERRARARLGRQRDQRERVPRPALPGATRLARAGGTGAPGSCCRRTKPTTARRGRGTSTGRTASGDQRRRATRAGPTS